MVFNIGKDYEDKFSLILNYRPISKKEGSLVLCTTPYSYTFIELTEYYNQSVNATRV